ncbi:MAG: hypothetical protein QOG13_3244 [Sphingomonadales bacterium]|jgi:hypothetical protein|nr:hypothetical protein [Sphingomonadales bacterium]MEA3042223.1 hypothetical protein [Sphingomonadales bacterium]
MRLLVLCLLILTAAAQPGRAPDRVIRTETVTGRLTGWEMGDYLWARISVRGSVDGAQPGPDPIGPFLEAHRGRPLTITIATVSTWVPEAGGMTEIRRITGAREGRVTALAWWRSLTPARRRAARRAFEAAIQ